MHRSAAVLLCLLSVPSAAQDLVSRPRVGEQETVQAGGGTGRFSFVGTLRCPEGRAIVGVRVAQGPLLNFIELACAAPGCEAGQCRWRAGDVAWGPAAGNRTGAEATLLCPTAAIVSGFRASVVPVPLGSAVRSLSVQCAPLSGMAPDGSFAVGATSDPRVTRAIVPPGRAPEGAIAGACRDRSAAAFSVAVGAYPAGTGGQGAHVRALSMFCAGLVE